MGRQRHSNARRLGESIGRTIGKAAADRHYLRSIGGEGDFEDVAADVVRWAKSDGQHFYDDQVNEFGGDTSVSEYFKETVVKEARESGKERRRKLWGK